MELTIMETATAAGAVAAVAYTLITFFIFVYIVKQLGEAKRSRKITAFPSLRFVRSPKDASKRLAIYEAYCENPGQFISRGKLLRNQTLHAQCKEIVYVFSEIGIKIHHGLLDPDVAIDWLQNIPAKMWVILRNYITEQDRWRGQDNYSAAFKKVAALGLECWLEAHENQPDTAELVIHHSSDPQKNRKFPFANIQEMLVEIKKDLENFGWA